MALGRALLIATETAVTAGADATAKTTALLDGLVSAFAGEPWAGALTPNQQNHVTALRAELAANVNSFVTALAVA